MAVPEILLAKPRGFCAGVERALEIVGRALDRYGAPIYVRHEIVHNRHVVDGLRARGAVFVEHLDEIPDDATVIFSAHGVPLSVQREATRRGLRVFDATCPLVTKVHVEVARMHGQGREIVMIGHGSHPEVEGTMGQLEGGIHLVETVADVASLRPERPEKLAYVTQTTLSIDDAADIVAALRARFPAIACPKKDDICYATQNRQDAVKRLTEPGCADIVFVVGSQNSSNSNRLCEAAALRGVAAYLLDDAESIDPAWLAGKRKIGVTAGASAPEPLIASVIHRIQALTSATVRELEGARETTVFPLPKGLQKE
ncbi:MAG: 4-hydroxy-3-methylbut-2-enyl diphosphate reductase [Azoarcus sp.]|jgi:4-hydroxy-3-methylbut-2-enyl diphosphate reductase|nr:4-hydroxy-3-methylbut-2-enyl diphosphate reductase [Azoarcus sp.]